MIEYDGIQHFNFVDIWHKTLEGFEDKKGVDVCKTLDAHHAGYKLIRIDYKVTNSVSITEIINNAIKQKELFDILVTSDLYVEMMLLMN